MEVRVLWRWECWLLGQVLPRTWAPLGSAQGNLPGSEPPSQVDLRAQTASCNRKSDTYEYL